MFNIAALSKLKEVLNMKSTLMLLQRILMITPLLFLSFQVQADDHDQEGVEKISVIGSHIKRTDMEGPSPIQVIDREQIELSGYDSVSDVLRDLPSASLGGNRESAGSFPSSNTSTSLRGLHISNLLLLLNGRRMAGGGALNVVPVSAIERIEILKDGASSIYGSDAVGGVINIVTKKGDVGGQINVSGSLVQRKEGNTLSGLASFVDFYDWDTKGNPDPDERWSGKGDKLTVDASYGGTVSNTDYLVGGQVRFHAPLYLRDRKFGKLKKEEYSNNGSPGSWKEDVKDAEWQPFSDCPQDNIKSNNNHCGFDYSPYMQFSPQLLQGSVFLNTDTELGTDTTLSTMVLYTYTRAHSIAAPAPDVFEETKKADYRIDPTTAGTLGLSAAKAKLVEMKYRTVEEKGAGPRENILNTHEYQLQGTVTQNLGNTMELDANLNFTGAHYKGVDVSGYLKKDKLYEMLKDGTFVPTAPSGQKSDLSVASYEPFTQIDALLVSFEPRLTGELAEIGNQPLSFAVGGLGAWEMYKLGQDEVILSGNQWGGGAGSATEGLPNRWYGGLYGELSALFGNIAELQVALRSDYYSDFGFPKQNIPFTEIGIPVSPRVAVSIQPVKEVKFRASWGKGFKAPSLESLHRTETITYPEVQDIVACDSAKDCPAEQYRVRILGNSKLQPEYSENFNLGLVLEPVERLSFSFDLFQNNLKNIVTQLATRGQQSGFVNKVVRYEKSKGAEAVKKDLDSEVDRDSSGAIKELVVRQNNAESYKVQGFELGMGVTIPLTGPWDLRMGFAHGHLLYVEQNHDVFKEKGCLVPYYNWLNDLIGGDDSCNKIRKDTSLQPWLGYPRWRNQIVINLINKDKDYNVQLVVHNIPGQLQLPTDPAGFTEDGKVNKEKKEKAEKELDYYWQLDLAGRFALTKKSSVIVGVHNLLGLDRPATETNIGAGYVKPTLYSLDGRTINVRYTHNF